MAWEFLNPFIKYFFPLLVSQLLLVLIGCFVYYAYFHPLARFPGPKLYGGSDIPFVIHSFRGDWPRKWTELHKKYGSIIRVGINELSFINAQAWNDIYGQRTAYGQMEKIGGSSSEAFATKNIINADQKTHARQRRVLAYAFSDKALGEQEYIVKQYVDLLMKRLGEKAASDSVIDVTAWFSYTTFDILGDLAFGESFDCLKNSTYHPWIDMKLSNMKMVVWKNIINAYVSLPNMFVKLVPKKVLNQSNENIRLSKEKVHRRLALDTDRPDFMTHILRNNGREAAMTTAEIESNAYILIIAGSETTATILCGALYLLLRNPIVLVKLTDKIRSSFTHEEDINFAAVSRLPYLLAVFNEAFRLYPPVDGGPNRIVPAGGVPIGGCFVPGGTHVGLTQTAAYLSESNFKNPHLFVPERWLDSAYDSDIKTILQPFSVGPRNCIGRNLAYMEMRLIMGRLLWNFDVELMPGQEDWLNQKLFIVWEKSPLKVKLKPRTF